jgi:3-deoxy-D-manno-octulosonate 8-phosphate phosphatase (KDO 8-P phosphatase)
MNDINKIKIIVLDCDGVLTDGKITYDNNQLELKSFSAHDGLGVKILSFSDIKVAVVTGRESQCLAKRCDDLKITLLYQAISNKRKTIESILAELNLDWENVAYMGDDWNDWPAMKKSGLKTAPANANNAIKERVDWIAPRNGGDGAVRDLIDYILKKQGKYESCVEKFLIHLDADISCIN